MRREVSAAQLFRILLLAVTIFLVGYLAALALDPGIRKRLPARLQWFGEPASWPTIAIVFVLITVVCVLTYRARRARRSASAPIAIVLGLVATSVLLGITSYWDCHDGEHSRYFTPIAWAASLYLGGGIEQHLADQTVCPSQTPVALEIAKLSAIGAIVVGVVGVVVALFQSQSDRIRARFSKSITAVVGIDDDGVSMVAAVARTLQSDSRLVLITASADRPCVHEVRNMGAAVVEFDQSRPEQLESLRLWRKLDRLYLLSPDPTTNLQRLGIITRRLSEVGDKQRLPLIVRIDDPWQAEAWRAQQFGGSDTQWAADAVGKYEVTARRLLDRIVSGQPVRRIIVGGTSQLTLALCADMAQRQVERSYFADPQQRELPKLTLVGENADEYREDHQFRQEQLGVLDDQLAIDVVSNAPTVPVLTEAITEDPGTDAVILVDADPKGADTSVGTRLASRFPSVPIYAWDPNARVADDRPPIVGQLRTYRLAMDLPAGYAQDAWERAAMLIHERYAAERGHDSPATQPWAQLDEFYRGSNRRQVANALWLVEQKGGHTWNTWGSTATPTPLSEMRGLEPLEQLRLLGFDRDAATAMARAEHEDWCRYYRKADWKYGAVRDEERKFHEKLVAWDTVEADSELLNTALDSLANTLMRLRELGYRSRPVWERYRRAGTVTAEQRSSAWTWTSSNGETMQANAGDWSVQDGDGDSWSVRDDIFRATYQPIDGNRWRRTGFVDARRARGRETIQTLEGPATTADGDWVLRGEKGDLWTMPSDEFARRYEGPVAECHASS